MRALQAYTNDSIDQISTNAKIANTVDTLRLCYPLLVSLHHSISVTTHWMISSFQDRISHEQLSLVAHSVTSVTPLLDGVYQEIAPCDVQLTPASGDTPQCWIASWSASLH